MALRVLHVTLSSSSSSSLFSFLYLHNFVFFFLTPFDLIRYRWKYESCAAPRDDTVIWLHMARRARGGGGGMRARVPCARGPCNPFPFSPPPLLVSLLLSVLSVPPPFACFFFFFVFFSFLFFFLSFSPYSPSPPLLVRLPFLHFLNSSHSLILAASTVPPCHISSLSLSFSLCQYT